MQHNLRLACSCPPVSEVYKNNNILSLSADFSNNQSAPLTCHHYDKDCQEKGSCHQTNVTCNKGQICYAVWKGYSGNMSLQLRGCVDEGQEECQTPTCNLRKEVNQDHYVYYMCCCNADFCNLGLAPKGKEDNNTQTSNKTSK